ncbi:PDZ domain-containing protein 8 isoform X2 [Hermetia illucens]|uniref:PDZ domain-containing protein 8 isoform X2 n=1 Tax=Hermetia illucens TaxID=343691 RepID=UPI0018CC54E7|nr:PDZ domain-containing protein 8 isoform X2 [Hermetia illucens]
MNLTTFLLFGLMSLVIGAVLMILLQYYFFIKYGNLPEESMEQRDINERYSLPDNILNNIKSTETESKSPIVAINLVMQFLFHELKNSNKVRKWFYRKLSLELDELISKTTTGKLFDKLTIRDLDLGGQFPEIKNLRVHNADLHDTEGHIENLDLLLDLQYRGNFRLSIDADMVLGKKGSLTLKVKYLSGLARLQFTRKPYTHWSLSFLGDPQLELGIESQFQGRQMQSNVTNLIMNQIRKAVRRKHTLPNYKLRYKPFFHKTEDDVDCEFIPNGKLEVNVSQLSRLMIPSNTELLYCTLTLSSLPWVEARQRDDKNVIISTDKEIHKAKNQQIGIVFKQADNIVSIEAVLPNTPALKAGLRRGDVLISIEGKRVNNINQVAKIVKSLNRPVLTLRIERVLSGVIKNDAIYEDNEAYEDLGNSNVSFSRSTESVQLIGTKQTRKNSTDRGGTSSESSVANTPTNSPRKSKGNIKSSSVSLSRENSESAAPDEQGSLSRQSAAGNRKTNQTPNEVPNEIEVIQQHSTIDFPVGSYVKVGDLCTFNLSETSNYINLCVYGRSKDFNELLGYVNIPVRNIIAECSETSLGHYVKSYSFTPPTTPDLQNHILSAQSGFDPTLCYGDILLSFVWNGNPTVMVNPSETVPKRSKSMRSSTDKLEESDRAEPSGPKSHNFIRTHFHRTTQCDYCGKKIWLKDAVQCRDCSMCCHKKCITKCQNSTVCGPVDCSSNTSSGSGTGSTISTSQPEFRVTQAPHSDDAESEDGDEVQPKLEGHRQSFSDLLAQGLKRVNSANNLAIPGIVSSLSQNSRSLPPSPQHTPSTNPFVTVTQRLEMIPDDVLDLTKEQIASITESLIEYSKAEDMMSLAKSSSKGLYADLEPNERVERINKLLTKLRLALDSETHAHSNLVAGPEISSTSKTTETSSPRNEAPKTSSEVNIFLQTKPPPSANSTQDEDPNRKKSLKEVEHEMARRAILIAQSEERVHALSVIMLYLCTGLQHAQGVASQ